MDGLLAKIPGRVLFSPYIWPRIIELDSRYVWSKIGGIRTSHSLKLSRRDHFDQTNIGRSLKVHAAGTRRAGSRAFHWSGRC